MGALMTIDVRELSKENRGVVAEEELFALQLEQLRHDETYHREIARLTVQHRLNHMALHLCKYVGRVAAYLDKTADDPTLEKVIVDSSIIILSTANILNLRIADKLGESVRHLSLKRFGEQLASEERLQTFDPEWLLRRFAAAVGRMAKGCESIDHLEAAPFRSIITESIVDAFRVIIASASLRDIDLSAAIRTRLKSVKEKSIFHGHA